MDKSFALIVTYTCGKCVYLTGTADLREALKEFEEDLKSSYNKALGDKSFSIPTIVSAEMVKVYYKK